MTLDSTSYVEFSFLMLFLQVGMVLSSMAFSLVKKVFCLHCCRSKLEGIPCISPLTHYVYMILKKIKLLPESDYDRKTHVHASMLVWVWELRLRHPDTVSWIRIFPTQLKYNWTMPMCMNHNPVVASAPGTKTFKTQTPSTHSALLWVFSTQQRH